MVIKEKSLTKPNLIQAFIFKKLGYVWLGFFLFKPFFKIKISEGLTYANWVVQARSQYYINLI